MYHVISKQFASSRSGREVSFKLVFKLLRFTVLLHKYICYLIKRLTKNWTALTNSQLNTWPNLDSVLSKQNRVHSTTSWKEIGQLHRLMQGPETLAPEHKMMSVQLVVDIAILAGSFSTNSFGNLTNHMAIMVCIYKAIETWIKINQDLRVFFNLVLFMFCFISVD